LMEEIATHIIQLPYLRDLVSKFIWSPAMKESPEGFFEMMAPIDYLQLKTLSHKKDLFFKDAVRSVVRTTRGHADLTRMAIVDWGFRLEDVSNGPTNVIITTAENDHVILPSNQHFLSNKIPNSQLIQFNGETHFHILNHLEDIIRMVISPSKGFFQKLIK